MSEPETYLTALADAAVREAPALRPNHSGFGGTVDYWYAFELAARGLLFCGTISRVDYNRLRQPIIDAIARHATQPPLAGEAFAMSQLPADAQTPPISWRDQDPML